MAPACLRAAARKLPAVEFIVASDTHLGYRDQTKAAKQWQQAAAELARAPGKFILHLGDVVDGGREAQYPLYLAARDKIGKPVYEIPGNHDPAKLFSRHVREEIDTVVEHEWLKVLLLNNARTESHNGFLSDEQVDWIDHHCQAAAKQDRYVIIAMHVTAHHNLHPDRGWFVKPDQGGRKFYEALARHRDRVLATFHGHFHNGSRGWDDHATVHEILFPSVLYNLDRKLMAQKAPGYNLPEFRPGYTLARIAGDTLKLRYQPLGAEGSAEKSCPLAALG